MSAFELPFMRTALAAGLLGGNALALLGAFVLLRGVSFSGLAISQLAALGTVVGAVLGLHFGGWVAALACVALGVGLHLVLGRARGPEDAWVACLYVLAAAGAILVLAKAPHGESHTMSVFFGNLLALDSPEVFEAGGLFAAVLAVVAPWLHRWVWLSFDPLAATVAGVWVRRWAALYLLLFAAAMTVGIHLFGVLLSFAFLLMPAAAALQWSKRLWHLAALTPAIASACTVLGLWLAFYWDFPAGPFVAGLLGTVLLASGLARAALGE